MVDVHYMAYHTNLVVQTLSEFELVNHVQDLLATLYSYFSSFSKCSLKF